MKFQNFKGPISKILILSKDINKTVKLMDSICNCWQFI